MAAAVELRGVTHAAGPFVLDGVDLTVQEREQVVLLGPSGAGKTTLISLLNGSQWPTQGSVRLFGQDPRALRPPARRRLQRQVGTVYQDLRLAGSLRVVHNVNAGHLGRWPCWKALLSLAWPQERDTARRALGRVGLADKLDATTAALSGGEQQRVALARVLVQDPQLVLADEPISSVDPARAREVMDLLRTACLEGGKTLVASCHTTAFARTHFDRAVGLRAGRIVFDCPSHALTDGMLRELYHIEAAPGARAALP